MSVSDHPDVDRVESLESVSLKQASQPGDEFERVEILRRHYTDERNSSTDVFLTSGVYEKAKKVGSDESVLVEKIRHNQEICDVDQLDDVSEAISRLSQQLEQTQ